ncbi:MAG: threonine-phosphate decarboxylase CobD [Dyella sp.]
MLDHGGRLQRAVHEYGIAPSQWLDLSTGISPFGWSPPPIPALAWQRLPEDDDGLLAAARDYYDASALLPVAGSQAAIQALPQLRETSHVGVLAPGYAEHAQAWRRAGHCVTCLGADALLAQVDRFDVVVLIHPNNPGAERFTVDRLLALHASLAARGGWLVVDEAFIDADPEHSLCHYSEQEGLIVLRSVGKFFGLAGARCGFVAAVPALLTALAERLGPWTLSGPTRYVVSHALADKPWHQAQRTRLRQAGEALRALLRNHALAPTAGCELFQYCRRADAPALHRALARQGILTRVFDDPPALRFGLPGDAAALARLDAALTAIGA